jgi:hypothetical protein
MEILQNSKKKIANRRMQFCCGHSVYYKVSDMELVGLKWPHWDIGRPSGLEVLLRTWIATSGRNQSDQSTLHI